MRICKQYFVYECKDNYNILIFVYLEITVLEEGYDTFLKQQQPKEFFTEQELKSKNISLVNEWNIRCKNPSQYDPAIYEAPIDYSPTTDYGLNVECNIYMFLKFINEKYSLRLK
ncbi:hypothetical protein M2451_003180 [Dysgonomonas sp. PFB1-18]|uniref:DUF6146 family protein n=1 Tax=unclassified Dysgonomonas TaxID=2630389 RepID=UPI002473A95C|nr:MULTISPECIES: DUF6146 family protein [unclassified Dysgonomonas]MDH6310229.1 hypothetical protein [Dysgonomonas sp. PF1-14]MDH6340048.1 hypothetical protein [Dysgonomonas sp. PF1-16]MDH6381845.1 hypothetical protein [Dysgonomonas sp. PFB1-18]MDH6398913.1 hypothetical protein [Dysgonomonas sp. PF1-23]